MRIGQLSKETGQTIDTIRHYMDIGLLIPQKKGSQYLFDEKSTEDLLQIQQLKNCGFTLAEISRIFSARRISNLVDDQDIESLIQLYDDKLAELSTKKKQLEEAQNLLRSERKSLEIRTQVEYKETGVPLSMVPLLKCPECHSGFQLSEVAMDAQYIYEGTLDCSCGQRRRISKGVLYGPAAPESPYDKPDIHRELYTDVPAQILTLFEKAYQSMMADLSHGKDHGVVLETHLNAYCFLHSHGKRLPENFQYVLTDKYPEMVTLYKQKMDRLNLGLDILYIAGDPLLLPLRPKSVDVFVDFFGSNEHQFFNHFSLLPRITSIFAEGMLYTGTYFSFPGMSQSIQQLVHEYPEATTENFNQLTFERAMAEADLMIEEKELIGVVTESGNNLAFSFHKSGEKMTLTHYRAKVKSHD